MKKLIIFAIVCCQLWSINAQTIADFENFNIGLDSFLNGSDRAGGFRSGDVFLRNEFTSTAFGDFWSGWAISSERDTTTPGFLNQYSAITGSGWDNSDTYAVGYDGSSGFGGLVLNLVEDAVGSVVEGFYITNSTYAYLSMLNGDSFAKRFGGETGNDADFLKLKVKKFLDGVLQQDSIEFFFADYRFEDNSKDYIVKDWTWLDLTALGDADSLFLSIASSDVGDFGINTPAYFCIDQVTTGGKLIATSAVAPFDLTIMPNPVADELYVQSEQLLTLAIINAVGSVIVAPAKVRSINVSQLPKGMYWLRATYQDTSILKPFIR
ncbi:MAG: DUF4465 domain-containing protein [Saprospiraceae bacterium]|nr:DUF4465 domain-containing protein [Saprospiraceae bacterium]